MSRGPEGSRPTGVVDFAIIGSGFGGSVSALRLTEKGYAVTVLERGRRFHDQDFPQTTWRVPRYLWMPLLRCFGILEISGFKDIFALHGAGVGGGSLGYANVLMEPDERLFAHPEWKRPVDWQRLLAPHYHTARRMLGVATNPRLTPADAVLRDVAEEFSLGASLNAMYGYTKSVVAINNVSEARGDGKLVLRDTKMGLGRERRCALRSLAGDPVSGSPTARR